MKSLRATKLIEENTIANSNEKATIIHNDEVKNRVSSIVDKDSRRENPFSVRRPLQIDAKTAFTQLQLLVLSSNGGTWLESRI
jgi:hypothetical protein